MMLINIPKTTPTRGGDVLTWARDAQQCFRDIRSAFGSILPARPRAVEESTAGSASTAHPFKVYQRVQPGTEENPVYQYGVEYRSNLFKSLQPGNNKVTIEGLLNDDKSTGWFALGNTGNIWLGVTFDSSGNVTWAGIDNSDEQEFHITAEAWDATKKAYVNDDEDPDWPRHQVSRKLIASLTPGATGAPPTIWQVMKHNQALRDVSIDGRPARYPFDDDGGYPL